MDTNVKFMSGLHQLVPTSAPAYFSSCPPVILINQAKRRLWFDMFGVVSMSMSICMSHDYGRLPIVLKFGINVRGTKAEWCISKVIFISLPFQNGDHFVGLFRGYLMIFRYLRYFYWSSKGNNFFPWASGNPPVFGRLSVCFAHKP